jgi:hypothetical protein
MALGISLSVRVASTAVEDLARVERWVLVLTNAERARHGVPPLQRYFKLAEVAAFHSQNMAQYGFFAHQDPQGRSPQGRLELLHPELIAGVGENIAMVPEEPDEELAITLLGRWMDSPGHRQNILDATYSHLGVGLFHFDRYMFATQLVAAMYAELLAQKPPIAVDPGTCCSMQFAFHGRFPKADMSILVKFPDPNAKAYLGNGVYTLGACPLEPSWAGEIFSVSFRPNHGRGTYQVCMGRASSCLYLPAAIRITV